MSGCKKNPKRFYAPDSNKFSGIFAPTPDAGDTWTIDICSGGSTISNPASRGANLRLAGNEASNGNVGYAILQSGNVANALLNLAARASAGGISTILSMTGDYVDISPAGTVPTGNPASNACRLYSDAGTLKYRTSGGTVRTISFT